MENVPALQSSTDVSTLTKKVHYPADIEGRQNEKISKFKSKEIYHIQAVQNYTLISILELIFLQFDLDSTDLWIEFAKYPISVAWRFLELNIDRKSVESIDTFVIWYRFFREKDLVSRT